MGVLSTYGIPVPGFEVADDESGVLEAANRIGFPLVLKTAEGVDHKTEVAGVVVGITDRASLLAAYRDLSTRFGPRVMVSQQVEGGVEIGLGVVTDEQFGPVLIISAGGTLIELIGDRVAVLPRVDRAGAMRALDRLRIRSLLDGVRGSDPVDIAALAEVIVRFSELARDAAGVIGTIDVNPVIVSVSGAVAVDALMKPR